MGVTRRKSGLKCKEPNTEQTLNEYCFFPAEEMSREWASPTNEVSSSEPMLDAEASDLSSNSLM